MSRKKIYGPENVYGIYGVAWETDPSDPDQDPLELLNPDNYDPERCEYDRIFEKWGKDYVLVGWDLNGTGRDIEKRWESRTATRERLGKKIGDWHIYRTAKAVQGRFEKWRTEDSDKKRLGSKDTQDIGQKKPEPRARDAAQDVRRRNGINPRVISSALRRVP